MLKDTGAALGRPSITFPPGRGGHYAVGTEPLKDAQLKLCHGSMCTQVARLPEPLMKIDLDDSNTPSGCHPLSNWNAEDRGLHLKSIAKPWSVLNLLIT